MILHQINSIKDHNAFVPVKLPIHTSFEKVIKRVYQDYNFYSICNIRALHCSSSYKT